MKKWLKLALIPLLALFLAACDSLNKKEEPETPVENAPTESTETSKEDTDNKESNEKTDQSEQADGEESKESEETEGSSEDADKPDEDTDKKTYSAEGEEGTATIAIYEDGEKVDEFKIENIGNVSILDAMNAAEDLEFNFNEAEGVIDSINGIENDYAPNTWMYLFNGAYAELGVVSQTLSDGDQVDWYFGTIDDIPVNILQEEAPAEEDVLAEEEPQAEDAEAVTE
ncbi:DUF4430 domain-containing protein [Facklamia sp. DSM 111018]|uniref:DUF4430 domain-containing protein n=1 Tax=Facklamia lactis TaxID=2749967 RepID=A0ABS0LQH2_9LACT|nr:DUF4430 domain-containing protein [Facklamia lactis]MBG9986403.1 DUF4430 domain-containing protein [Facklamia lactis]